MNGARNLFRVRAFPEGAPGERPGVSEESLEHDELALRLARARVTPPATLRQRIRAAQHQVSRRSGIRAWELRERWAWLPPAVIGALTSLAIVWIFGPFQREPSLRGIVVHFQIHAPEARRVELLGDFNRWTPGTILLRGPDASGHWTAEVELPEGRYEYGFLVDGEVWVADPYASEHRPDGFGRENAVLRVGREGG